MTEQWWYEAITWLHNRALDGGRRAACWMWIPSGAGLFIGGGGDGSALGYQSDGINQLLSDRTYAGSNPAITTQVASANSPQLRTAPLYPIGPRHPTCHMDPKHTPASAAPPHRNANANPAQPSHKHAKPKKKNTSGAFPLPRRKTLRPRLHSEAPPLS